MNLNVFIEYCYGYYGAGGFHGMNYSKDQIKKATCKYLYKLESEFCGDTLDRERVLMVLEGESLSFLEGLK